MHWLQTIDVFLFHLVNPALANPVFDVLMPIFSGNRLFPPALVLAVLWLIIRGGTRGRIFAALLILVIALGDTFVCNTIKQVIHRPRPFWTLPDVHVPGVIGKTDSGSMPSSHAANWFAATMLAFIYYRRSLRFMLPMAILVSFSRIYNGVHYPGDVLIGAILGAGYAAWTVWAVNALWHWIGRRWFPLWWQELPSLLYPELTITRNRVVSSPDLVDKQWTRLAFILIFAQMFANLAYLASNKIQLTGDEAYQWTWSKHLALSYYSKPPVIAYTQWLGTHLWGDTQFGVRFFSPIFGAITAIVSLLFLKRVANIRAAFWVTLMVGATPLLGVGAILMTVDPPSVMFWVFAMVAAWRALQEKSTVRDWLWVGLWMGCGFLSKPHSLFQLASLALFFALRPPARVQLRRPGVYLALLVNVICALPVLIWNAQHHWITVLHISQDGRFDQHFAFTFANLLHSFVHFTLDFLGSEVALQNPFFFLPVMWAVIVFWRHQQSKQPLLIYLFCMGAPVFGTYLAQSFHARVLPNWIAQSILPFFFLGAVYWEERYRLGYHAIKKWLYAGLFVGYFAVVILHDTNLLTKLSGYQVSTKWDSTRRAKGWTATADAVEAARQKLLKEGKPVFIIGSHYEITGELSFYMPEAKASIKTHPLVYFETTRKPVNQFYFWPGYQDRVGQNALFVQELDFRSAQPLPLPELVRHQFDSVEDLGVVTVSDHGQPVRHIQIFACRNLLPP